MAPSILVLQRQLRATTASEAQTPHEASFRAKYLLVLRDACATLQAPDLGSMAGFEQAFEPLRAVTRAIGEDCRWEGWVVGMSLRACVPACAQMCTLVGLHAYCICWCPSTGAVSHTSQHGFMGGEGVLRQEMHR